MTKGKAEKTKVKKTISKKKKQVSKAKVNTRSKDLESTPKVAEATKTSGGTNPDLMDTMPMTDSQIQGMWDDSQPQSHEFAHGLPDAPDEVLATQRSATDDGGEGTREGAEEEAKTDDEIVEPPPVPHPMPEVKPGASVDTMAGVDDHGNKTHKKADEAPDAPADMSPGAIAIDSDDEPAHGPKEVASSSTTKGGQKDPVILFQLVVPNQIYTLVLLDTLLL